VHSEKRDRQGGDNTNTAHQGVEVDKSAIRERLRLLLSSF